MFSVDSVPVNLQESLNSIENKLPLDKQQEWESDPASKNILRLQGVIALKKIKCCTS